MGGTTVCVCGWGGFACEEGRSARRCRREKKRGQRLESIKPQPGICGSTCTYVCFVAPLVSGLLTCRSRAASMPGTQHGNNDLFHSTAHMRLKKHTFIATCIPSVFNAFLCSCLSTSKVCNTFEEKVRKTCLYMTVQLQAAAGELGLGCRLGTG